MNIYVPGKGQREPNIAFVGEAPSWKEEEKLEPFVGPSGALFDSLLRDCGISRDSSWLTNVCKYMVPANPKKGRKIPFWVRAKSVGIERERCIEELRYELQQVSPKMIVCLGNTALEAVTGKDGIKSYRGSLLPGMNGVKTLGTYNPAHILHQDGEVKGYWNKTVMALDLTRASYQSRFRELDLPKRTLHVARSSSQFADFLYRYKNFSKPSIDIEADPGGSCIPICIGIAFTPYEGITIPLWNHKGISDLPDSEIVQLWNMVSEFLETHEIEGQNFGYDESKLKMLGISVRRVAEDCMLKSFAIYAELPKNLAFNTSIRTLEPFYKDEGMYEGSVDDLLIGCARDACVTKEVSISQDKDMEELGTREYYENFLIPLRYTYLAIENRGIRVDPNKRRELIVKYITWNEELNYKLHKICGHAINVQSPPQVSKLLYDQWKIPERSGTGEEVLTSILNSNVVKNELHREGISLILEGRRVRKTISTYLFAATDYDNRMRTSFFLCLETGRSSTNQQEPPIRPWINYRDQKKVKKKQARGMAFQTITKHGDIGQDIRSMLVPDEGYIFLQADSSQAEARVIFLLANEDLRLFDEHDLHALTASWFFGGTESDYSKKVLGYETPLRFAGKTLRHAGHLGAGKRRAAISVNTDARKFKIYQPGTNTIFQISEKKADEALKVFHARQPSIKGVYHASVIKALEKNRRLIAPVPVGIKAGVGGVRIFYERWGDELNRQAFSYIPQRSVSENTKCAALYIDRYGEQEIQILMESHDSLLVQCKVEYAQEVASVMRYAFERPIDFSKCSIPCGELVIPCEVESGMNYQELSKFKWNVEVAS